MSQTVTLTRQGGNPTFSSLTVTGPTNLSGSISTSGSLFVSGSITAQSLVVNTTTYSSGSNVFGNSPSNTQVFTGSMYVAGLISGSVFYGSGANLIGTATGLSIGGNAATATSATTAGNITAYTINQNVGTGNSPSFVAASLSGNLSVSTGNVTGGGIILADDGDIVDLNDGFCAMRFSSGVRVHAGNRTGGVVHTLHSNGTFTATGNVTAFSDARVKTNIKTIDNALSKVLALRGVTYNRTDLEDKSEQIGVIAQEVKEVLPQVVQENDGHYSVAYGNIVGVLIEAIKEQQLQIEELKSRL